MKRKLFVVLLLVCFAGAAVFADTFTDFLEGEFDEWGYAEFDGEYWYCEAAETYYNLELDLWDDGEFWLYDVDDSYDIPVVFEVDGEYQIIPDAGVFASSSAAASAPSASSGSNSGTLGRRTKTTTTYVQRGALVFTPVDFYISDLEGEDFSDDPYFDYFMDEYFTKYNGYFYYEFTTDGEDYFLKLFDPATDDVLWNYSCTDQYTLTYY